MIINFFRNRSTRCYAVVQENPEDNMLLSQTIKVLLEAGYKAKTYIAGGTVFGYVWMKSDEYEKVSNLLSIIDGVSVNPEPIDRKMEWLVK